MPSAPNLTKERYLAMRVEERAPGFAVGRQYEPRPEPAKTVYVTVRRPAGMRQFDWHKLVTRLRQIWTPVWVIDEATSPLDAMDPGVTWIFLCPVDLVLSVQASIGETLRLWGWGAHVIWAESTPRTIQATPEG